MYDKINLLPPEIKQIRKAANRNKLIFLGVCTYVLIMVVYFISMSLLISSVNNNLEEVKQNREILRTKISQYSLFEKREKELDARKELIRAAQEGELQWSRIMYKLSLLLPPQVWLSNFKVDEGSLVISGNSLDLQGVSASILQMLSIEELTDKVVLQDIKKDDKTQTMLFNINTDLPQKELESDKSKKQKGSGQ